MTELLKVYGQDMPPLRFDGKKYGEADADRGGGYGSKWGEGFDRGYFAPLESLYSANQTELEDGDAYIGLMRYKPGEPFEYWIGMFLAPDAEAPEGYEQIDFPASRLGVAWLKGPEQEIYSQEELAMNGCAEAGFYPLPDEQGACWFMERYGCPRFTTADDEGNVILDIGVFSGWNS